MKHRRLILLAIAVMALIIVAGFSTLKKPQYSPNPLRAFYDSASKKPGQSSASTSRTSHSSQIIGSNDSSAHEINFDLNVDSKVFESLLPTLDPKLLKPGRSRIQTWDCQTTVSGKNYNIQCSDNQRTPFHKRPWSQETAQTTLKITHDPTQNQLTIAFTSETKVDHRLKRFVQEAFPVRP